MDPKQFRRRALAVAVLLALMVAGMGATLYDLQINNGADYYEQSQRRVAETQTVESARGQILDRNGQVLVSNRVVYQVTLDTSLMKDEDKDAVTTAGSRRNDTLLALIEAARAEGVEWTDNLPISKTEPFTFTTDTPYYTTSVDEEGEVVHTLTRLGRLALELGWLEEDPTLDPEKAAAPAPEPEEPGLLDRIVDFFTGGGGEEPAPEPEEEEPYEPPDAQALLGAMCRTFGLRGAGAVDEEDTPEGDIPPLNLGDLDPEDARAVAGVLYELYLRSTGVYQANEYVFAQEVDIDFISRVKEQSLPGVVIEATTVRQYHTPYAAHLLGRVTPIFPEEVEYYTSLDEDGDGVPDYSLNDTVGRDGVEQAFESYLRGDPGMRTVERNTEGKIVSETWLEEPEPGGNVVLTLDIGLQGYVEQVLAASVPAIDVEEETGGAACVVLDVDTAEVLTCASYPTYDITRYNADYNQYASDPTKPLLNRALQGLYAPGSTFKMVTAVAGLETGIIEPDTEIEDLGRYTYWSSPQPMCWIYWQRGTTHGWINVSEAIEVSCNYFFYEVGREVGIDVLVDYATRFGLGQYTGIELFEEKGVMASPEFTESLGGTWYEGSVLSVAIGQESSQFTPVQLANYIATLVNGGTRNAVHLLKEVKSGDFSQVEYTYEPQVLGTIEIETENLQAVKAGMLALTTQGSVSQHFRDLPFQAGGKTGSAQVDDQTDANAIFVCFAPYDDPEVALALVVERGGSGSELGAMAADILSYYFSVQETRDEAPQENTLVR